MGTLFDHNGRPFSTKLREWSLITGMGGGATKREGGGYKKAGGATEVLPLQKGVRKSFSHAQGGDTKRFEVV